MRFKCLMGGWVLVGTVVTGILLHLYFRQGAELMAIKRKTLESQLLDYGPEVRKRLAPSFNRTGVSYPPQSLIFLGLKKERLLEVWVSEDHGKPLYLKTYPILGASGTLGPKLREGDGQVPEGFYEIESLNPNSAYHLSLKINYPNNFDLGKARMEGRNQPGSDIMIHGNKLSVGCLAIGDEAAEDLFVLAADTGIKNIRVILSPVDFRLCKMPDLGSLPRWTEELYRNIQMEVIELKKKETLEATKPQFLPK